MTTRQKLWISMAGILVLTALAGVVDYPNGPDIIWRGNMVRELKVHLGLDLQGGASLVYEADLSNIEAGQEEEAMAGVRDVLERRVNAFGVSEPLVQTNRSGESYRVLVELPGITDINRAVQEIGETPLLEFKTEGPAELTDEQRDIINNLNQSAQDQAQEALDRALSGEDFAALATELSQDTVSAANGGDLGYFESGQMVPEFETAAFGAEPGTIVPEVIETEFGYHVIKVDDKTTGKLSELNEESAEDTIAEITDDATDVTEATEDESSDVATEEVNEEADAELEVEAVRASHILIQKVPEDNSIFGPNYVNTDLTGKQLQHADVEFDSQTNTPIVSLQFDAEGATLFEDMTRENEGKTIAIYLDNEPISTPVVNQTITGGQAVIEGGFDIEEAKTLARRLNAGALPVDINLVNQRNVGPTLGAEAIQHSVVAGIFGLIILVIYMIAYYRLPGVVAVIALGIYGLVLLAIFKLWPITLSLSGIAGFILSLGIAVDANVLIFERFKEELRNGKSLTAAVEDGFKRAWLSIRDSNVSSLITCLILIWFGTSVIKGFAVTLAIGIILSMFSAITITRNILKIMPVRDTRWFGIKR